MLYSTKYAFKTFVFVYTSTISRLHPSHPRHQHGSFKFRLEIHEWNENNNCKTLEPPISMIQPDSKPTNADNTSTKDMDHSIT
jgi:hypothetical protein